MGVVALSLIRLALHIRGCQQYALRAHNPDKDNAVEDLEPPTGYRRTCRSKQTMSYQYVKKNKGKVVLLPCSKHLHTHHKHH
ncbi:hypothetical protein Hanom_Chr14g01304141 [Helianthus anomalus]